MSAQIKDVPVLLALYSHLATRLKSRLTLACNEFDERGLAASVRTQNRDVLARPNTKVQIVQS